MAYRTALVAIGLALCVALVSANPGHDCGTRGGHCEKQNSCKGVVLHGLCNGGTASVCCIPRRSARKAPKNKSKALSGGAKGSRTKPRASARSNPNTPKPPNPIVSADGSRNRKRGRGRGRGRGRRGRDRGRGRGRRGVDLSTLTSRKSFKCLKQAGWDFAIVRAFQSNNKPDINAPTSLKNAAAAGYKPKNLGVYLFPCANCGPAKAQFEGMVRHLKQNGAAKLFKWIWLDIEEQKYWPQQSSSRTFFTQLLAACQAQKEYRCGVYTSQTQWTAIMGKDFTAGKSVPLWYPHYQYVPEANTKDFVSFGGWKRPYAKQYNDNQNICGVGVDVNVLA